MKISVELIEGENERLIRLGLLKYNKRKSEYIMKMKDLIKILNDPKTEFVKGGRN